MRFALLGVSFAFVFSLPLQSANPKSSLVDGTAARVGKRLLTIQEAYYFHALKRFLEGGSDPLQRPSRAELKKSVQRLIFEEMVFREAGSFQFPNAPKKARDVIKKRTQGKRQSEWKRLLKSYSVNENAVIRRVEKSAVVEAFVERKVETLTPVITQAEIEQYYNQNKGRFRGNDPNTVNSTIEVLLKKQRVSEGLEEWVRFLKRKYQVVNYLES